MAAGSPPARLSVGVLGARAEGQGLDSQGRRVGQDLERLDVQPGIAQLVGIEAGGDAVAQHDRNEHAALGEGSLDPAAQLGTFGGREPRGAVALKQLVPNPLLGLERQLAYRAFGGAEALAAPAPELARRAPAAGPPGGVASRFAEQRREDVCLRAGAVDGGDAVPQLGVGGLAGRRARLALMRGKVFLGEEGSRQPGGDLLDSPLDLLAVRLQLPGDLLAQLDDRSLDGRADRFIQSLDSFRKGHPLLSAAVLVESCLTKGP